MWGTSKTIARLDEMITQAIDGDFVESNYDESQLSRLESKLRKYLGSSQLAMDRARQDRESIKGLVTDISHQVKTPLSNILLYTELLEEELKSFPKEACQAKPQRSLYRSEIHEESQRDFQEEELKEEVAEMEVFQEKIQRLTARIHEQAEKLDFLLQALVKISRLESGMIEVQPTPRPIGELVEKSVGAMEDRAARKRIKICLEPAQEAVAVYDLKWSREALENLLDNAVKYSPEESRVEVAVTAYELFVCVEVRDFGPGISEEESAAIFERFYRGKSASRTEGSGVGLYLTRMILQKQKGYVRVKSKEGEGSRFLMYLPRFFQK